MAIVVPSASEETLSDFMLGVATPGNQEYRLFTNDYTPDDASVAASFTEMSTLGYALKELTKTSWVSTAGASGQPCSNAYAEQTWTFTAGTPVTVYGYYVTDKTTGKLLWAERFAAAKIVQYTGDQIRVTPTVTMSRS
jgi:hypothetical protein